MGDEAEGGGAGFRARFRIVVLGGGTAGWMTAAALARQLPGDAYAITLVESDEIGTVGVGEATLPHIKRFNDMLGLDEAAVMAETRATFKLGIEFVGWDRPGESYIHPFGAYGEPWGGVEFQHHWHRLRAEGREADSFAAHSFAVQLAQSGGFSLPNEDPASIRSTFSYAYHLDAGLYANLLRRWATARGVRRVEGKVRTVERREDGSVAALRLENGETIAGDLFIDCSGFRALLLAETMGVGWEDWRDWLPCDRALAVPCAYLDAGGLLPYTRATAHAAGWQWRIPLQHRIGNGIIYASEHLSDEAARAILLANLDGPPLGEPRLIRFAPGRRHVAWAGNVVGVGLAAGFLEPLESTSIFLIQAAVSDLVDLMPRAGQGIDPRLAAEFNRLNALQYERVRDFLILHYVANRRVGEPFWDRLRTVALPDSLAHKLALFRARGTAPDYEFGLFSRDSWLAVLEGQGVAAAGHDPLADTFDLDLVDWRALDFRQRIAGAVADMPRHRDFVAGYCPAPDLVPA